MVGYLANLMPNLLARRHGVHFHYLLMRSSGTQLEKIAELVEAGKLRPVIDKVFPLEKTADAFAYTCNPLPSRLAGKVIRGKEARWADHDPRPCQMPPDWSGGYTSLFAVQQEEAWSAEQKEAIAQQGAAIRANA